MMFLQCDELAARIRDKFDVVCMWRRECWEFTTKNSSITYMLVISDEATSFDSAANLHEFMLKKLEVCPCCKK